MPLLPRAERSASILQAAARAFARTGFASTSMEDVAAEAGITKLIVYRHFDSKEELYRAVLDGVTTRLAVRFVAERDAQAAHPERIGYTSRTILAVAREDPDALRLLFVHAEREPQFRSYALLAHEGAVAIADELIGDRLTDPVVKAWAAQVAVRYLVNGVLVWLDVGDPERDEEFISLSSLGIQAMFGAWTSV